VIAASAMASWVRATARPGVALELPGPAAHGRPPPAGQGVPGRGRRALHPIAGGLGMNSGIQDAYNLGWKLGLVLAGYATSGLLATYEEERLPIASWLLGYHVGTAQRRPRRDQEHGRRRGRRGNARTHATHARIPVEPALPPHRNPVHRTPAGRPGTGRAADRRRHRLAHPPFRSLPRAAFHPARSGRTLRRGVRRCDVRRPRNGHGQALPCRGPRSPPCKRRPLQASERAGPSRHSRPRSSSACRASAKGLSSQARWSASP